MMAKSHYWVVSDAVAYIKKFGDDAEKSALQTFELAYGSKKPLDEIPAHQSAVEHLVGFESLHTDKFGDLALSLRGIPGPGKRNVVGLGFHMFTAFNHFINPLPDAEVPWPNSSGYAYETSSMKGIDSLVVKGITDHLSGVVDVENSLVLERLRASWQAGDHAWAQNFSQSLSATKFAPWNVLAGFYYEYLLDHHYEPLEVRGPNQFIVGAQLMGPVVHAAADTCSVQHVRSTLGFGHVIWENYLKSKCYNRQINANAQLIREFFSDPVFSELPTLHNGPLTGCLDIGAFVNRLAIKTAERLQMSTRQDWRELWRAGDDFWRGYLLGAAMRQDAEYLYNMAVAATVKVLRRSYEDLARRGVLSPGDGLTNPNKLPRLDLVQDKYPALPEKKLIDGVPSEEVMPVPLSKAEDMLGFQPIGRNELQQHLHELGALMGGPGSNRIALKRLLSRIEEQLIQQYERMSRQMGDSFCPLRALEKIPLDSDISAHFGAATFRMPSSEECDDPQLFEKYMQMSDAHAAKAYKLQLTQIIAGLKFTMGKFQTQPAVAERFNRVITNIEAVRDEAIAQWTTAVAACEVSPRARTASERSQPKEHETESVPGRIFKAVLDWLSPLTHIPVTALATAAAAVLLLVVLIPHGVEEPFVGISSEKWEKPQITLMAPKSVTKKPSKEVEVTKPRLAVLIYFKGFKKRPSQQEIDALYKAARPKGPAADRFDIVSPEKVGQAIAATKDAGAEIDRTLELLKDRLNITRALMVTVAAKKDGFLVESAFKDLGTGKINIIKLDQPVKAEALGQTIEKSVAAQLMKDTNDS
ncbi:MAG: hypothetical protein ACPL7J_05945 [Desulfomonilaceae bacterium]